MTRGWLLLLHAQAVLLQAGWIGARLMIGYKALDLTSEPFELGLVVASLAAPSIAIGLPAGRLADRWGGAKLSITGTLLCLLGCVAAPFSGTLVLLILSSAVLGLGQLLFMVGQHVSVAERSSPYAMDQAYGELSSAISIGQLVGPVVVTVVVSLASEVAGVNPSDIGLNAAAALFLLAVPVGVVFSRSSVRTNLQSQPQLGMLRTTRTVLRKAGMWRALLVSGAVLAAVDLLYAFIPVWAVANGVPIAIVGWLLGLRALVTVISRLGLGWLVRVIGRKALITGCLLLGVLGFAALPLVHQFGAVLVMVAFGLALGLPQPLTISWVVSRADEGTRGAALGLRITSNRVMQVCLPLVVGAIAAPLGVSGIFWGTALALLATATVTATAGTSLSDRTDD